MAVSTETYRKQLPLSLLDRYISDLLTLSTLNIASYTGYINNCVPLEDVFVMSINNPN